MYVSPADGAPPMAPSSTPRLRALSLFSNCGAGDVGYRSAGFDFRVMAELNPDRLEVALTNHPNAVGVSGDLRETWTEVVAEWRKAEGKRQPDLLAACPPCQGMSSARSGLGRHDDLEKGGKDPRNLLVTVIEAVALELRPRVIVVENVPAFLTRAVPHPATGSPISAALLLIDALAETYRAYAMVSDLADWGVPQTRKRSFLTLIRMDEPTSERTASFVPFPRPTHAPDWGGTHRTINDSLAELAAARLDASSKAKAADPKNPMHSVPVWNTDRYRMIASIPANSGKSAWQNQNCSRCDQLTLDPDVATCQACGSPLLRPVVKGEDSAWRLIKGFRTSSYARMKSDAPASTVTTASGRIGSDKTIHPFENRVLSPLECAHLQTLPDSFAWGDALKRLGHTSIREMIGEAVPPRFTEAHGLAIRAWLADDECVRLLPASDLRVSKANNLLARGRARVAAFTPPAVH